MPETTRHHPQYADPEQQRQTAQIGMWIFLATEVMFFGPLFTAYAYFHYLYPDAFAAAARQTDFWLGSLNTAVLLVSSLAMALAVQAARTGERRALVRRLLFTIALGTVFLSLKGLEYSHHIAHHLWPGADFAFDPADAKGAKVFFYLYFAMTGLHALHMIGGITLLSVLALCGARGQFSASYDTPVELGGLYWHFIDVIWLFLFPLFYLVGGHR